MWGFNPTAYQYISSLGRRNFSYRIADESWRSSDTIQQYICFVHFDENHVFPNLIQCFVQLMCMLYLVATLIHTWLTKALTYK